MAKGNFADRVYLNLHSLDVRRSHFLIGGVFDSILIIICRQFYIFHYHLYCMERIASTSD